MENAVCINCHRSNPPYSCGICQSSLCKSCAQFVDENHFAFMDVVPEELTHGRYCGPCFEEKIAPELAAYDAAVERAKVVHVFYVDDAAETRLFNRQMKPVVVENKADRSDALMCLAYIAVKNGHNTLVDVQVHSEKVDLSGYRTSKWTARGVPVTIGAYIPNRKSRFIGRANS
jgi:hypothetical protein